MSMNFTEAQTKNILTFLSQFGWRNLSFLDDVDAQIEISVLRKQISAFLKAKTEPATKVADSPSDAIYQLNDVQTKNTVAFLTHFSCRNLVFLDEPDAQIEIALLRKQILSILKPSPNSADLESKSN